MAFEDLKAAALSAAKRVGQIADNVAKDVVDSLTNHLEVGDIKHQVVYSCFLKSALDNRVLTCRGFNEQITVEAPSDPALHAFAVTEEGFVVHLDTGLVLDVFEGRYFPEGEKIIAYRPLGSNNQRWYFHEGFLISRGASLLNRVVDICEGVGPGVILWTRKVAPHECMLNQQWIAVPASSKLWCQRCRAMSAPGSVLCDQCREPLPMAQLQHQEQRAAPAPAFSLEEPAAGEEPAARGQPRAPETAPEVPALAGAVEAVVLASPKRGEDDGRPLFAVAEPEPVLQGAGGESRSASPLDDGRPLFDAPENPEAGPAAFAPAPAPAPHAPAPAPPAAKPAPPAAPATRAARFDLDENEWEVVDKF